jgi:hypothetical protein
MTRAAIHEQLERICRSSKFKDSPRMVDTLRFLVEYSFQHSSAPREIDVALGLGLNNYDPAVDNSVRHNIGELRKKLSDYYVKEGARDDIIVEVPRGEYKVEFHPGKGHLVPSGSAVSEAANVATADEFMDFWTWLRETKQIFPRNVGIAGAALAFLFIAFSVQKALSSAPVQPAYLGASYSVQILVIVLMLVVNHFYLRPIPDSRFKIGLPGCERLIHWWNVVLISLMCLYVLRLASLVFCASPGAEPVVCKGLHLLEHLSNNLSTLAFLMCFATMEYPDEHAKRNSWAWLWWGVLVAITCVEAVLNFPKPAVGDPKNVDWFALLSSANAGIALGMFCSRLSSPLINPPLSIAACLYLYVLAQITYAFWHNDMIAFAMANVAWFLKCLLFMVIVWIVTTRHLILYMESLYAIRTDLLHQWRKEASHAPVYGDKTDTAQIKMIGRDERGTWSTPK